MTTLFNLPIMPGKAGQWLRVNPTETGYLWDTGAPPITGGYFFIQDDGVTLPQRSYLNFINYFIVTDNVGNMSTDVNLDIPAIIAGGVGTVKSVDVSGGATGLTTSGGPITTMGTITLDGILNVMHGGTGQSALTAHGVLIGNGTSPVNVTLVGLAGQVLTSNGPGLDPTFQSISAILQTSIQFQDEGINLGTPGTVDTIDFVGAGVVASRVLNKITVTIPGGGGSGITIQDEGVPLPTLADTLNFVGAGVTASGAGTTKTITIPGVSGAQVSLQFQDEGINLGAPGTADVLNFVGGGVTASRIGNTVTVNIPTGGGSGVLGTGTSFLPIGASAVTGGSAGGDFPYNNIFTDSGTNRLYVTFGTNVGVAGNKLRIFKNDFGSYRLETEVVITNAMTTVPAADGKIFNNVSWTTNGTNLYAIVKYLLNFGPFYYRIDVCQFTMAGVFVQAVNIYNLSGFSTTSDRIDWARNNTNSCAATIVGTSLFTTYATFNGGTGFYDNQFKEFDISAFPVVALLNTYAAPVSPSANLHCLRFNSTNSTYYFTGDQSVVKYTIVGPNFTEGANTNYPEFLYGSIGLASSVSLGNLEFAGSAYAISVIEGMTDTGAAGGGGSNSRTVYWLRVVDYPLF